MAYGHLEGPYGPSRLDYLILGNFFFILVTFYFGSLLILGHFIFWVTFYFRSLLILGHF